MGQVISIIFGRLFGGKKRAESESPKPNHEDYSTLRSYYIDIIKEHDHNKEAAAAATPASFDPHHRVVTIFPQRRQQPQSLLDPLVDDDLRQPLIATNSVVASITAESTTEAAFYRYHHVVPIYPQQQQQEEAVLDPLVEELFYQPLISTNSTVASSPAESTTVAAFHRHHHVVPIYPQQQEEEAVLDLSVEEFFYQPLLATNSTVAGTTGVEGTEELTIKSIPEEAPSTKRKRKNKKKSPKNEEAIVKEIGPYVNTHKILLVGEGDFSFSASLATAFGIASNIIATSLNEKAFLTKNYKNSMANIQKLESRGALVIHVVDATKMAKHKSLKGMKFDRIIFNFPHTCRFGRTPSDISRNQELVLGFLKNGKKMIEKDGEIHVTHKTSRDYAKWNIAQLGATEDLNLIVASPFDPNVFPGYDTKYGHGGDKNFDCFPCKTYKFRLGC